MASDDTKREDLRKSDDVKEQDRQHAKPFVDAVLKTQPDPNCPRCGGKGAYYKNIMLDVALCTCRKRRTT